MAVWAAWALELIRSATTSGRERKQLWCECTFLSIFDSKLFPLRHGSGALSSSACNLVSTLQCYLWQLFAVNRRWLHCHQVDRRACSLQLAFVLMDVKNPFRDLSFDGRPAGYREFLRKVILSVASLEDKQQHLAGPHLLNRRSGEAWRATEHLSVASIRSTEGWLEVLKTLDKH